MKITPALARLFTLRHLRSDLLPWAIALAVGIDYFDNTIFSFFTSYIAGGINASPDELVWSSTAYATASVLGIVQQQWLIERLGFRRYLSGCLLMFAAGSLAASLSESSLSLAMARGLQGYFIGPMLGTCRIMLQTGFTPQDRAPATRVFLVMILLASALAPMAGGCLVAYFDWRALFMCSTIGGQRFRRLHSSWCRIGKRPVERRSGTHLALSAVRRCAWGAADRRAATALRSVQYHAPDAVGHRCGADRDWVVRLAPVARSTSPRSPKCATRGAFQARYRALCLLLLHQQCDRLSDLTVAAKRVGLPGGKCRPHRRPLRSRRFQWRSRISSTRASSSANG